MQPMSPFCVLEQKPPKFITLMKGKDEEVQLNLDEFVDS
jgi:hypothetical protein